MKVQIGKSLYAKIKIDFKEIAEEVMNMITLLCRNASARY